MPRPNDPFSGHGFGASAPWLDLVNSEMWDGFGHFSEQLDDPAWLRGFLCFWKVRRLEQIPAPRKDLRQLRTLLRHLVEETSRKGTLHGDDIAELNEWLKVPVFPHLVENQNVLQLSLQPVQFDWDAFLAVIARSFAETLAQQGHNRLKICANEDCRWIFVDRTKGNVRRWCNDATCGNRDRVRRYREKKSAK